MLRQLRYGSAAALELEITDEQRVTDYSRPRAQPLPDLTSALRDALQHPLELPPLAQVIFPGDRVALAIDRQLPQAIPLVGALVQQLIEGGSRPEDLTVVQTAAEEGIPSALAAVPADLQQVITLETHDPRDGMKLAYLAASKKADAIYFNRTLCDADVVLPLSLLRPRTSFGYRGVYGGLFPAFSDEATQQRFLDPQSAVPETAKQLRAAVKEAAWLLGIQFVIGLLPGPGDSLHAILAGEGGAVANEGQRQVNQLWRCRLPQPAGLVVAAIEGGPQQQTWENLARALYAASSAVEEQGVIALCTELEEPPGPAVQYLAAQGGAEPVSGKEPPHGPDSQCATLVRALRERAHVYLLSQLDENLVEDLGLAYIARPEEVNSLSRRFDSCVLLSNAQHAVIAQEPT